MAVVFNQAVTSPVTIGRPHEIETLYQFINHAKYEQGKTVIISGEVGVGKSRLITEAKARAPS